MGSQICLRFTVGATFCIHGVFLYTKCVRAVDKKRVYMHVQSNSVRQLPNSLEDAMQGSQAFQHFASLEDATCVDKLKKSARPFNDQVEGLRKSLLNHKKWSHVPTQRILRTTVVSIQYKRNTLESRLTVFIL